MINNNKIKKRRNFRGCNFLCNTEEGSLSYRLGIALNFLLDITVCVLLVSSACW